MKDCRQFYIDGKWVAPKKPHDFPVVNPATEATIATISLGSAADVELAVAAAKRAFATFSETTPAERLALLQRIIEVYQAKYEEMAETISQEMGAPIWLSRAAQAAAGLGHFFEMAKVLPSFQFEELRGSTLMRREPIGVCGLITPWNWPVNQIACKVAPALAAGCTMVLKPSEIAPLSGYLFTQILHEAGVPAGVFNMVNGDGPDGRRRDLVAPRRRHGVLHGLDARRRGRRHGRGADGQARHAGAGRQVRQHHPRRRRPRADGRRRGAERRPEHRAVVQRADAHARPARHA